MIVEEFDDYGIPLHGRIYNQGDGFIKMSFVCPLRNFHFTQTARRDLLESKADVEFFAEVFKNTHMDQLLAKMSLFSSGITDFRENISEP